MKYCKNGACDIKESEEKNICCRDCTELTQCDFPCNMINIENCMYLIEKNQSLKSLSKKFLNMEKYDIDTSETSKKTYTLKTNSKNAHQNQQENIENLTTVKDIKVNILSTEYTIKEIIVEQGPYLKEICGSIDHSAKLIIVESPQVFNEKQKADSTMIKDLDYYRKKVIRHEIIHAYLYESGLSSDSISLAENKEMVDWMAILSPEIFKTFKKLGCL